eukprot:Rmarinus@m.3121
MCSELRRSFQVLRSMLSLSVITISMLVRPWSSKWLRSITSTKTLSFRTKRLSKKSLKLRRKRSLVSLKKVRSLKERLRTSLLTVCSLILEVLTDLSISLTFLGDESIIQRKSLNW